MIFRKANALKLRWSAVHMLPSYILSNEALRTIPEDVLQAKELPFFFALDALMRPAFESSIVELTRPLLFVDSG